MSAPPTDPVLAVDIGGTSLRLALIDLHGSLIGDLTRYDVPFAADGAADLQAILALMEPQVDRARQQFEAELRIGISLCGNVDLAKRRCDPCAQFGLAQSSLRAIGQRTLLRVRLRGHRCQAAALAEAIWGVGVGVRNFAWATVGTGYGGYLLLNGRLYGGAHGFAGNFGHTTLDEFHGFPCGCGRRGCFETFVAGPAIARAGTGGAGCRQQSGPGETGARWQSDDGDCVSSH